MSAKELMENVGKSGMLKVKDGFHVAVGIMDARKVFNRIDYQVSPISGIGKAWVEASQVKIDEVQP